METRSKPLHISSKCTLEHYARELKKKYPKYSQKELYLFIKSAFDHTTKTLRELDPYHTEDITFLFGDYFKFTLNAINRRYDLYYKAKRRAFYLLRKENE